MTCAPFSALLRPLMRSFTVGSSFSTIQRIASFNVRNSASAEIQRDSKCALWLFFIRQVCSNFELTNTMQRTSGNDPDWDQ
jgi:hypothetical protein